MILRLALGGASILEAWMMMEKSRIGLWSVALFVIGVGLILGFLLIWFCACAFLIHAAQTLGMLPATSDLFAAHELFTTLVALALLLLGPGALSLDARIFGRREVIIPESIPVRNREQNE